MTAAISARWFEEQAALQSVDLALAVMGGMLAFVCVLTAGCATTRSPTERHSCCPTGQAASWTGWQETTLSVNGSRFGPQ